MNLKFSVPPFTLGFFFYANEKMFLVTLFKSVLKPRSV